MTKNKKPKNPRVWTITTPRIDFPDTPEGRFLCAATDLLRGRGHSPLVIGGIAIYQDDMPFNFTLRVKWSGKINEQQKKTEQETND